MAREFIELPPDEIKRLNEIFETEGPKALTGDQLRALADDNLLQLIRNEHEREIGRALGIYDEELFPVYTVDG